jgi:Protein of unknown function (DUF3435)
LAVDDLLLLLNHHWARDTSTFPTERYRVQFALVLLLLFATGCWPTELVDSKKKTGDNTGSSAGADNDDEDFDADDSNDSGASNGGQLDDVDGVRLFDELCYEDIRLLVVRGPGKEGRDVLAMEVKMSHHKGHNRRPKS